MNTSQLATRPTTSINNVKNLKIVKDNWNRWTKNGEDRLYLENPEVYGQSEDAYIDLSKGKAVGFDKKDNFGVGEDEDKIVVVTKDLEGEGQIIAQMQKEAEVQ